MLAPFFGNLLIWCVLMLLVGWVLDVVHGWIDSAPRGASLSNRPLTGPARRFKPHVPVCVDCDTSGDSLLGSGMPKGRKNA
jgi:hypothetical protein